MVVGAVGQPTARPHRLPFRGFGCDSVSLEGGRKKKMAQPMRGGAVQIADGTYRSPPS